MPLQVAHVGFVLPGSLSLGLAMMERVGIGSDPSMGMWASPLGRGIWDFLKFISPGALNSGLSTWERSRNTTSGCAIPGDTFPADSNNKTSWKDPQGWILAVEFCPSQQGSEKAGNG